MSQPTNPSFDVAHLGHVEMLTDKFEESLDFFTRIYGLKCSAVEGDSAYLRAWDDYEFHSLKLTRAASTGVGRIGYRCASPEALERRVAVIEASGRYAYVVNADGQDLSVLRIEPNQLAPQASLPLGSRPMRVLATQTIQ